MLDAVNPFPVSELNCKFFLCPVLNFEQKNSPSPVSILEVHDCWMTYCLYSNKEQLKLSQFQTPYDIKYLFNQKKK
jgi:hypothetical protein